MPTTVLPWHSLKTRITLSTLVIFLMSLWALSLYASRMLQADMERLLGEQQAATAAYAASELQGKLDDRIKALELVAQGIDTSLIDNPVALQKFLDQRFVLHKQFNDGVLAYRVDGTAIAESPFSPERIGVNYLDRDYLVGAIKNGKSTIGQPVVGKTKKVPNIVMAAPIRDAQGKVIGALSGVTNLGKPNFLDKITDSRYGKTGGFFIMAPQYRLIVTATDKTRVMETLPPPGAISLLDRRAQGFEGSEIFINPKGVETMTSAKGVPVAGWYVSASLPVTEAFAPIHEMKQRMWLATLFLTLLAGGLTWWILRRQFSALQETVKTLADLADTDKYPQPLSIRRQDEIGQLVGGFNRLLDTLGQREETLRKSEERNRGLLANLDAGIVVHAADTSIITNNHRASVILGLSDQQMSGKLAIDPEWTFLHENHEPFSLEEYPVNQIASKKQAIRNFVLGINRPATNDVVWVSVNGFPELDSKGEITEIVISFFDITERKQVEERLRESEDLLNASQRLSMVGGWAWNVEAQTMYWTEEAYRIHDLEVGEIESGSKGHITRSAECYGPEDRPVIMAAFHRCIEEGVPYDLEFPFTTAKGRQLWIRTTARPVSESGKVVRVIGNIMDITERKQAEKEQYELTARYRLANKATNDVIWDWDVIQDTQRWNEVGTAVFGWTEIVEHPVSAHWWVERIHPDDQERVHDSFFAVVSNPERDVWHDEYRFRKADDAYAAVMDRGYVMRDAQGQAIRMIGAMQDITERKQAEAELERHRHHLEELVADRTASLEQTNLELTTAKLGAEAANRAKSQFVANMSHELRTPMNAIMGMTGLALRRATDPPLIEKLTKIDKASRHLLSVINDILDISKIEAGRLTLERGNFKFGLVLENLVNMVGQRAAEKGLALRVDLPPEIAQQSFSGDPLRLGQILLNLTYNAIKFTARGSVTVRIIKLEETLADVLLRCEVLDTGIGIAPEDQKRLFTAFEQVDGSMTRKYGGTGLGLVISQRLAELMGGDIALSSTLGQGSIFWLTVRLDKTSDAVPPAPTFAGNSAETQLYARHAGTRILLAEDEPVNQEVSRGLLEYVRLTVELAEDGEAAVAMAQRSHYDLILMDMQMPQMNGIEATQMIRAMPDYADTPILAMTASAFDEDRRVCLDAGMDDHIGKPVDSDKLYETLLKWLDKSAQ